MGRALILDGKRYTITDAVDEERYLFDQSGGGAVMNESKGFISVGIDMQEVRNILSRLDQDKREKALKDALKQTAEKARNRLS